MLSKKGHLDICSIVAALSFLFIPCYSVSINTEHKMVSAEYIVLCEINILLQWQLATYFFNSPKSYHMCGQCITNFPRISL